MKIKKVEIEGFRAYKYKNDGAFDFTNEDDGPSNFVAIYAPNGFGKSSFYDAVEWALTNHLERLGGDYNGKNYELAAKSSKQQGVGLKILRNKDITDDFPTSVTVSTTWKKFKRSLPTRVRANSRDFGLRENKHKEAEYFRDVILTQDAVDRFLREAKPYERYKRFMEFFGEDLEQKRQEQTVLINDTSAVLQDLKKKKIELEEQLKEPIDESIFSTFNSFVANLNHAGESIPCVTRDFSIHTEREILSLIASRIYELTDFRDKSRSLKESLMERISQLPDVQRNLDFIAAQRPRLAKLSQGVVDAQRYEALQDSHKKYVEELQLAIQRQEKLFEIKNFIPNYLIAEAEIRAMLEQREILTKQRADLIASVEEMEFLTKQYNDNLVDDDQRILLLRTALTNSDSVYAEILIHKTRLKTSNHQLSQKNDILAVAVSELSMLQQKIDKISAIKINANTLLSKDVSSIGIDKEKLSELDSFIKELSTLEMHDQTIRQTQDALKQQMNLHERLISTGLEYLSAWPTKECPLCHKEHPSDVELKNIVKDNDLVSSLVKENAQKLEESGARQKALKELMDSTVSYALELQNQRLSGLRSRLYELGTKMSKVEQEKVEVIVQLGNTEQRINTLLDNVCNLEKNDFEQRIKVDLKNLELHRNDCLEKLAQQKLKMEKSKFQLANMDSSINTLGVNIEKTLSQTNFEKVKTYITTNGVSSNLVDDHCSKGIEEYENFKKIRNEENSHIIGQCTILQNKMESQGTWIDFFSLTAQKDEVERLIANAQSLVDVFFETISQVMGLQTEKSVDAVRNQISVAMRTLTDQYKQADDKLNQFNLLVEQLKAFTPYLTGLEVKKALFDIEQLLTQYKQVDERLREDRALVLTKLEEKLDAFFFTDLINSIYRKIDPHPSFKEVEFRADFDSPERPGLHIFLKDHEGNCISPILYFSTAQMNILSLSVFLANALHATDDKGTPLDVILIDDPIQSMDSINILSTIDLLKSISIRFDKQIIISTHDENFFGLLQRKVPSQVFGSKFLRLESFGVVVPAEPFLDA